MVTQMPLSYHFVLEPPRRFTLSSLVVGGCDSTVFMSTKSICKQCPLVELQSSNGASGSRVDKCGFWFKRVNMQTRPNTESMSDQNKL